MKTKQLNSMFSRHSSLLTGKRLLGKKLLVTLLVAISSMFSSSTLFAQTSSTKTVYQDWKFVGESTKHVDVSARIVKCSESTPDQVHLFIFNEGSTNNAISFVLTVKDNDSKESFSTTINHTVDRAVMIKTMCDSDESLNDLKINLPSNYNPNNLTLSITFN